MRTTLEMFRPLVVVLGLLLSAPAALACSRSWDISEFERVLLPVYTDTFVFGLSGGRWRTESLVFPGPGGWGAGLCPGELPVQQSVIRPRTPFRPVLPAIDPRYPGRLLYVLRFLQPFEREEAYSLRVNDAGFGSGMQYSTEIPVVREKDFRTAMTHLIAVPTDRRARVLLRVYDIDARAKSTVLVRILTMDGQLLTERQLDLVTPSGANPSEYRGMPAQPGYGEFPYLHSLLDNPPALVRFEIQPLTPGLRYWAFATITDNVTHQVTTVTPR